MQVHYKSTFREFDVSVYHREQLTYIALTHRQVPIRTVFVGDFAFSDSRDSWRTLQPNSFRSTEKRPILRSRSVLRRLLVPSTWWWYEKCNSYSQNRYNNIDSDHSKRVLNQMDDIKDVMISNIDKILQRGEKLELVIDKTNDLADAATVAAT